MRPAELTQTPSVHRELVLLQIFFCLLLPEHLGTTICEGNIASVIKSSGSGTFTATSLIMHLEIDQSEEYVNNIDQLEEYVNCIDQSEESINSID